ncbi:unnamed protein product [Symbiodinium sp. CCMP2456]|nr:unnamed protein product [Symbiodinium sp. CCMP2456]
MSRGYYVTRKYNSEPWPVAFQSFLENDLDVLKEYFGASEGADLIPANRPGEEAPFKLLQYDVLMKQAGRVTKANITQVRAAVEAYLLKSSKQTAEAKALQVFLGHSAQVSAQHYQPRLCLLSYMRPLMPGSETAFEPYYIRPKPKPLGTDASPEAF